MVVFGSKSSSAKTKLFEQPLDKLLSPKTVKQLNEAIRKQQNKQNNNTHTQVGSHQRNLSYHVIHNNSNSINNQKLELIQNTSDIIRDPDEDERCRLLMLNVLPEPIRRLLGELFARGPGTVGIFRKSPNAKHCKELRQKLETTDGLSSIEQYQVNVIASVFKEWLRSLPDCLLMSRLYPQWIDIAKLIEPLHLDKMRQQQQQQQQRDLATETGIEMNVDVELHERHSQQTTTQPITSTMTMTTTTTSCSSTSDVRMQTMLSMSAFELRERHSECVRIVRQLLDALNETNLILLRAIVCVLWHIAGNSDYNKMCSNNLGVCIGQSLLNDEHQHKQRKSRRSSSLGLSNTLIVQSNYNLNTSTSNQSTGPMWSSSSSSSALKHFSTSTFAKRHRRSRSQGLLASTLSLTNLSSHLSSSPSATTTTTTTTSSSSTTNLQKQTNNNSYTSSSSSTNNYLNTNDAQEAAKYVPILVAFMIDNAVNLFGSDIVNLFGPRRPQTDYDANDESQQVLEKQTIQKSLSSPSASSCSPSLVVHNNRSMEVVDNNNRGDVCSRASNNNISKTLNLKEKDIDINDNTLKSPARYNISHSMDETKSLTTMSYLTVEPNSTTPNITTDSRKPLESEKNLVSSTSSSSPSTPKLQNNSNNESPTRVENSPELIVGASAADFVPKRTTQTQLQNVLKQHRRNPSMSFITVQIGSNNPINTSNTLSQAQDYTLMKSSTPTITSSSTTTTSTTTRTSEGADVNNINLSQHQLDVLQKHTTSEVNNLSANNNNNSFVSSSCSPSAELTEAGTTTSILIINTPKKLAHQHQHQHHRLTDRATSCDGSGSSRGNSIGNSSSGNGGSDIQSDSNNCSDVDNGLQSQSVSPSCGSSTSSSSGCPLDDEHHRRHHRHHHHDDIRQQQQQQQRPLSATESTTSSSRASSSTSGVHSQSPAFSNESNDYDRHQSDSSNNVSGATRGSHRRSLSTSISSPDSSASSSNPHSICTSPNADDMDTVDGMVMVHHHIDVDFAHSQHNQTRLLSSKHRLSESQLNVRDDDDDMIVVDHKCSQISKLVVDDDVDVSRKLICLNNNRQVAATMTPTTARIVNRMNLSATATVTSERPKSMVNLNSGVEDIFVQNNNNLINNNNLDAQEEQKQQQQQHNKQQVNQQFMSHHYEYTNFVAGGGAAAGCEPASTKRINNYNQFQSQTLNRYSTAACNRQQQQQQQQQHPVMFNRLPKIPFQYTTSCYGGEAVVYYPSNAHISQQQKQQQQLHHQQSYPHHQMHRGCNRIQSLDRQSGSSHHHYYQNQHLHQQQQQQQQQMPQRSHVMMLRDYYLSLQEQSHRQQQQQQLISHQRVSAVASISHGNYLHRAHQQQQQRHYLQRQHSTSQQLVAPSNNTAHLQQHHHRQLQSMQSLDLSRPSTLAHHFSTSSTDSSHDLYPQANSTYVSAVAATNKSVDSQQQQQQQQPASAAIAYQRIRPRLAKIRQNQFNGLYVKRASSPHSITSGSMGSVSVNVGGVGGVVESGPAGLNVLPLDERELSEAKVVAVGGGISKSACAGSSLMTVSQSSLSQQSSKMSSASDSSGHSADEESDDCSTEWMESTMV